MANKIIFMALCDRHLKTTPRLSFMVSVTQYPAKKKDTNMCVIINLYVWAIMSMCLVVCWPLPVVIINVVVIVVALS